MVYLEGFFFLKISTADDNNVKKLLSRQNVEISCLKYDFKVILIESNIHAQILLNEK